MARYSILYCRHCRQEQSFRKPHVDHVQNLALSIVTAGIYLIPYAVACYRRLRSPWRCRVCRRTYRPDENDRSTVQADNETVAVG